MRQNKLTQIPDSQRIGRYNSALALLADGNLLNFYRLHAIYLIGGKMPPNTEGMSSWLNQ